MRGRGAVYAPRFVCVATIFLEQGSCSQSLVGHGESGRGILRDGRIGTFAIIFQTFLGKQAISEEGLVKLQDCLPDFFFEASLALLDVRHDAEVALVWRSERVKLPWLSADIHPRRNCGYLPDTFVRATFDPR